MGVLKYKSEPNSDFDWSLYENGYNGRNLIVNKNVKTNEGDTVYCHESYAAKEYLALTKSLSGDTLSAKDQIVGTVYNVKEIKPLSNHEVVINTDGGMSAVIDMNKECQFISSIGCDNVQHFMGALKDPDSKQIILQHACNAKVVGKRVSIWEGLRSNIENDFMDQLKAGTPRYGYEAKVLSVNNGGYTVDVNNIKCFLPGSLAASGPITDFESLVGKTINVCIVNYSKYTNSFVVSHKKYLELTLPARVANELEPGMRVNVKVTGRSKNGLFCAIRDVHGEYPFSSLMHRSTMSPIIESSFDRGEFMNGDVFMAYIHRIEWSDDNKYRIVIGDQKPDLSDESKENEND